MKERLIETIVPFRNKKKNASGIRAGNAAAAAVDFVVQCWSQVETVRARNSVRVLRELEADHPVTCFDPRSNNTAICDLQ